MHLTSTDALSGTDNTYYSLDGSVPSIVATAGTVVSPQGVTTLRYFTMDKAGNRETTRTATVRIDSTPPVTTSNAAASYVGAATITLVPTDSWSGPATTRFRLDDGIWTQGTTVNTSEIGSHVLEWYSTDVAGNTETTRTASFDVVRRYDNTEAKITYLGTWATSTNAAYYNGTIKKATLPGAAAVIKFDGTGIDLLSLKGPTYGIARVICDGQTETASLYSPTYQNTALVWRKRGLGSGEHTVRVEFTGTKDATSTDTMIDLDAVDVVGTLVPSDSTAPVTTDDASERLARDVGHRDARCLRRPERRQDDVVPHRRLGRHHLHRPVHRLERGRHHDRVPIRRRLRQHRDHQDRHRAHRQDGA